MLSQHFFHFAPLVSLFWPLINARKKAKTKKKTKIQAMPSPPSSSSATDRLAALLDDRDFVTRTLSEVTGEPLAAVEARLDAEEQDTGINVTEDVKARNLKMGVWSDDLIKFYQVRGEWLVVVVVAAPGARRREIRREGESKRREREGAQEKGRGRVEKVAREAKGERERARERRKKSESVRARGEREAGGARR